MAIAGYPDAESGNDYRVMSRQRQKKLVVVNLTDGTENFNTDTPGQANFQNPGFNPLIEQIHILNPYT